MLRPWSPPSENFTGTAAPAFTTLTVSGLSTGLKNPVKAQVTLMVAVSVLEAPNASVTWTSTVRVAGALLAGAANVTDCPGDSKEPSLSRSHAKVTGEPSGSVPVAERLTDWPSMTS